jgi:hypothetical protein
MNVQLPALDALGRKYGTDKSSQEHDYLSFYEFFFERIRHERTKILEIGVLFGASLRLWEEYFPNGVVIGADIDPTVKFHSTPRILTEVIDQSNLEDLVQLGVKHGPFNIIIEDGSHLWEHQITTLKTLFPFLKDGGYYIVEDLHTNYGNMAAQYRGYSKISFVEYAKKLLDLRVGDDQIPIAEEEDQFLRTYARNIEFLTFYKKACVLRKNYRPKPRTILSEVAGSESNDIADSPLTNPQETDVAGQLSVACHIGKIGNRQSSTGALTVLTDGLNIQGFALFALEPLSGELEYQARLADGTWTEWVGCEHFVGTIGMGQDLTGFSARISSQNTRALEVIGFFRGETSPVVVEGGGQCVSQGGPGPLYGMQLVIRSKP